jgi:hypothetical protein
MGPAAASAAVSERQNLGAPVEVPPAVMSMVHAALPEARAVSQSYLVPTFDPNIVIGDRTSVDVTFLSESTENLNTLGYFTYEYAGTGIRILERGLVLPNASMATRRGKLNPGDTATLRDANGQIRYFEPGTHLGFFVIVNGWTGSEVRGWDEANPQVPFENVNDNHIAFTSLEQLNPETAAGHAAKARHVAMIGSSGVPGFIDGKPFLLMGLEDLRRDLGSDDDFNDLVFVVHSEPNAVLSTNHTPTYTTAVGDPDGDGVSGLVDAFPADPTRAIVRSSATATSAPSTTVSTVEVMDGQGQLKDVQGTFSRAANQGAAALELAGLPADAHGVVRIERFSGSGTHAVESAKLEDLLQRQADGTATLSLRDAFLGERGGQGVESIRVAVTFDEAVRPDVPAGLPRTSFPWTVAGESAAPGEWLRDWSVGVGP